MSNMATISTCSKCGLSYRDSLIPHQCAEWTKGHKEATKEQPMSDTLQEEEDQMGAHRTNASGNCSISGCPCRGWSQQESAKTKFDMTLAEFQQEYQGDFERSHRAKYPTKTLVELLAAGEINHEQYERLRRESVDASEHEPAARGETTKKSPCPACTATGKCDMCGGTGDLMDDTEIPSRQALVAEREQWGRDRKFLGDRLEAQAETMAKIVKEHNQLRLALEIIRDSFWSENEPFEERVEYLQQTAKDILITVREQRSTSA